MSVASLRGDAVTAGQRLPSFELAVTAKTVVMGAAASRDWQPQHHDHAWAVSRAGTREIFLNTPNQAGWIERYLTDWTGSHGRLGRMAFRMRTPVCPGDTLVFNGTVRDVNPDESGSTWVGLDVELTVNGEVVTECAARIALPTDPTRNPWALPPDQWRP